jgi:hypothetical protein
MTLWYPYGTKTVPNGAHSGAQMTLWYPYGTQNAPNGAKSGAQMTLWYYDGTRMFQMVHKVMPK